MGVHGLHIVLVLSSQPSMAVAFYLQYNLRTDLSVAPRSKGLRHPRHHHYTLQTHHHHPSPPSAMVSSNLELHRYATGRKTRVMTAMTLLKSHLFR